MKLIFLLVQLMSLVLWAGEFGAPNVAAPVGGNFSFNLRGEPNTLHPIKAMDFFSRRIFDFTMDTLGEHNFNTYEMEPRLAERWEISKDNKEFTFYLRKDAVFHDGKPVTAEDVKFSFDAIFDPKYEATALRPFFENIEKAEILQPLVIKFTAKNVYFKNFDQIATMMILPKHVYGDLNKSRTMNRELIGAGPYRLEKFDKGDKIVLRRFDDWYGFKQNQFKGYYNFERMTAKFIRDETLAIEMLKKGDLDYTELRADAFKLKAIGEPWGSKIIRISYANLEPKNWYFYGMNFKSPLFQSKNVRLALTHLMDRESMAQKFLFGYAKPAAAPMWPQNSAYPTGLKALPFDPEKAAKLLKAEGWKDTDEDGILDKMIDGKKVDFKFTLIHPSRDYEKYHTWYQEDLKKAGIEMEIKMLDWSAFEPALRDGKFDMMAMAWGGGDQEPDPKQLWHSGSVGNGGSNYIGYKNLAVDKLIEEARVQTNPEKRVKLLRKIYEKIAEDAPYICWFHITHEFYGVNQRVGRPGESLKFKLGLQNWWIKP